MIRGRDNRYSISTMGAMGRIIVSDSDVPEIAWSELQAGLEIQQSEAYFHEQAMTELSLQQEQAHERCN